jgi:hypothetical protein
MRELKDSKNPQVHFENVAEWLEYAAANCGNDEHFNDMYDQHFQGGYTGKQMLERVNARTCNESTRKEVHKKSVNLPPLASETSEQDLMSFYASESGLFLDTVAYHNGEQDNMITFDLAATVRPVVWIACNIGGMARDKPKQFRNRGIALFRAIHALERAGVSIGLLGYSKASGAGASNDTALQTIVVKQPDNSLDESTLINIFADVAAFRTIAFTVRGIITEQRRRSPDMGCTMSTYKDDYKLSYASEHNLVILPYGNMTVYNTAESATDFTLEQVREQTDVKI